ncbi:MAG: c-type cytochrome domain-containing protein [Cyclobacteriaceae bacterium]
METPDIVLFFGRFHPLILHLPIGFLLLAFLLELLSRIERFSAYRPAVGLALFLGAASALVAAALGYMLAQGGGYGEDLLGLHQWLGIASVVLAFVAFFLYRQRDKQENPTLDKAYISTLSVMVLVLMGAGHYGGSLTHGSDYLTQYMPNPLRKLAGLPEKESKEVKQITNLPEAVVYTDIIHPILDSRCVSCHNPDKKKGELMMHTAEALLAGGENGDIFVPGNPEESEMLVRVHLPEEDEQHMPPDGKSQLTDEQITLLTWWVAEGAPFEKKVAELTVNDETQSVLNTLVDPNANKTEVEILLASEVTPADEQLVNNIQQRGVMIMPLAEEVHWLQVNVPRSASADSLMSEIGQASEQITWLDLGNTATTDEALSALPQFKNLTRLHLENTKVTDAGLVSIAELPYLEYLNLYGTQVTNEGVQQLAQMKNLRKLYLWQTKVTSEGAAQLREANPNLEINLGVEDWNSVKADSAVALR